MANYIQGSNLSTLQCLHGFREKKLMSKRLMVGVRCAMNEEKSERKKLKILIAGGGIGGLVFALAAKTSGFDVKVFEKDLTAVRGEGRHRGPIQLLSSALGFLETIDKNVATQIMEAAGYVSCDRSSGLADGTTGQWFVKLDYRAPAVEKGVPVTQIICRIELQRILVNAVGDGIVINNSKVVDFVSETDKVTVILENGEKHEGDILVGADGMRSMVRQKLFGHAEPKYSNFICYTGVAEFDSLYLPHFGYKIFVGTNQYFVAVDIGKGRMQWYAFVRWPSQTPIPSSGYKEFVVECFGDWCNEVIRIINRTTDNMIIPRLIHDIDVRSVWGRGRVVLLGDAAHAMLPNLGQGGSMAIEDCYWLMLELQNLAGKHSTSQIPLQEIELAFKRFEKKRMFRVRTLHCVCRIASVMTSHYHTYLHIPLLLFFNLRLKHPAFVVSSIVLKLVFPKFMEWVIVGQE